MPSEEVVATDALRFARRTSARSQQRLDAAIAQPALPSRAGAGHTPLALVFALRRRAVEQRAGASSPEFAVDLHRHQRPPAEATPKWFGLLGQADRPLV